jgi:hypothetical protein
MIIRRLSIQLTIFFCVWLKVSSQEEIGVSFMSYKMNICDKSEANFIDSGYLILNLGCLNQMDSLYLNTDKPLDKLRCPYFFDNYEIRYFKEQGLLKNVIVKYLSEHEGKKLFFEDSVVCHSKYCELYKTTDLGCNLEQRIHFDENTMTIHSPLNFVGFGGSEPQTIFDSLNYALTKYHFSSGLLKRLEFATIRNGETTNAYLSSFGYEYLFFKNSVHILEYNHIDESSYLYIRTFDNIIDLGILSKLNLLGLRTLDLGFSLDAILPFMLLHFPELIERLR